MNNKEMIPKERAVQDVRIVAERLAMLYYHFVNNLIEEFGEEKTEEIVKKVIYQYGLHCGTNVREKVLSLNKETTLENYALGQDLPSVGWEKRELDTQNPEAREITYCPFADTWKKLNFEKWGRLYCYVDQAKYEGYNSSFKCYHDKNTLDGEDSCIIRVEIEED
ncbi:MAG: L-2-amino-thiazoline-4-carboxylic acid hydrolase [Tissierellia bacterium]|nr:L-2-amino-thiazoline-4-carboxylic acid hydrolase [Tissierellia bacterium]